MNIEERHELIYEQQGWEKLYRDNPNNCRLLQVWQCYKKLGDPLPDDLQEAIDRYLEKQLINEISRRRVGEQGEKRKERKKEFARDFLNYKRYKNAVDPAAEKKKIAGEECVSPNAIEKRFKKIREKFRK